MRRICSGIAAAASLVVVSVGIVGCPTTGGRPNVVLITVESMRPDYLSCYGGRQAPTPHIDALAHTGVLFAHAFSDVPWTRGAMASVLTGRYATQHGVRTPYALLPAGEVTVAEEFRAAGYRTAAVVSLFDLDHVFQFDQGFVDYDDRFTAPLSGTEDRLLHLASRFYGNTAEDRKFRRDKLRADAIRGDAEATDAALAWLRRAPRRPFLLWVHYFAGHERSAGGVDVARQVERYQPAVTHVDAEIGRLTDGLAALGLDANTVIVLHADQSRGLLDPGGAGRGGDLYDVSIHVPLIIRWPGHLPAGRSVESLVRLVDIFPTLAELAGVAVPPGLDGQSLVGLVDGGAPPLPRELYGETYRATVVGMGGQVISDAAGNVHHVGFVKRAVRTGRWKLIRNEPAKMIDAGGPDPLPESFRAALFSEELYDLLHDPAEQTNVIGQNPAVADDLRRRLDRYAQRSAP